VNLKLYLNINKQKLTKKFKLKGYKAVDLKFLSLTSIMKQMLISKSESVDHLCWRRLADKQPKHCPHNSTVSGLNQSCEKVTNLKLIYKYVLTTTKTFTKCYLISFLETFFMSYALVFSHCIENLLKTFSYRALTWRQFSSKIYFAFQKIKRKLQFIWLKFFLFK
jgi:hypothetical protein